MLLYYKGAIVPNFNATNVRIATEIKGAGGDLTEYFLHIYIPWGREYKFNYGPDDPNKLWLVWTNPNNTNESYKLGLFELNIAVPPIP